MNIKLQKLTTTSKRLRYIRSLLRVSRAYIQEKYGLPEITLKTWENGTTKLTKSGLKRCLELYRSEGLVIGEDWITDGVGLDPTYSMNVSHYFATPTNKKLPVEDDEVAMIKDANIFKENNLNAVVMVVSNNEMVPFYKPGDYVGGKMRFEANVETALNKDCIIYLKNGEHFFRRLIKNIKGGYNLTCLNPSGVTSEPVLYNVDIEGAAPIIWHRRKDE